MISSEVQRTLVKSPPELWAEISDPESLARHLGEFGEIRITRVEPEQRVEWEAGDTSGSVIIKPSGWGTKVKLTVTRELTAAEGDAQDAPAPDGPAEPEGWSGENEPSGDAPSRPGAFAADTGARPVLESGGEPAFPDDEPQALGDEPEASDQAQPAGPGEADDAPALAELSQTGRQAAPESRRGFFARLFGRRRGSPALEPTVARHPPAQFAAQIAREQRPAPARYNALAVWASQMDRSDGGDDPLASEPAEASPPPRQPTDGDAAQTALDAAPSQLGQSELGDSPPRLPEGREAPADAAGEAGPDADGEPLDIPADSESAEEVADGEVTAVLTGVLDRLGAAHHRPFSRA